MSWPVVTALTVLFIALSAFFVAVEFALLAAKRHRLEDAAPHSRSARAALRSSAELTVLLAGSQLGITACALALGAVTKPAVHYGLTPVLESWGLPYVVADVTAFILALLIVTFLHLVIGEMAPKSWAIAHPELSATMLALPMRGFMAIFRPVLVGLNSAANWCLRQVGVEPVEEVTGGSDPDDLRHLVEHSVNVGSLDPAYSRQLAKALDLHQMTLADLTAGRRAPVALPHDATVNDVLDEARRSGHLRILITPAGSDRPQTAVHVRDTLLLRGEDGLAEVTRPVFQLPAQTPLHTALSRMRETANHLVLVPTSDGEVRVVTLADVLATLFPRDEETQLAG